MPDEPKYPGVYIEEIASAVHSITGVPTSITAFVGHTQDGPVNEATEILSFGDFERTFGGLASGALLCRAVYDFFENGGTQAYVVRAAAESAIPGTDADPLSGDVTARTGMYALENVELFNLLVIPEASEGAGAIEVLAEAIAYCERRRGFLIVDAPSACRTADDVEEWAKGPTAAALRSRNSALYFPWIEVSDPTAISAIRTFPAAGALAGLFARTDAEGGVWKAPAGTAATVVGAAGLAYTLTDAENGVLNPLGINCLRTFPVQGTVAWGARTGMGGDAAADEFKYIPVRRLALYLEESLYRGTRWVVFEPNDEPLWAEIRRNVGVFMHALFAQGAFAGRKPDEAYFVKCGRETMTQADCDSGRVNVLVGFAPLMPAEFVIIRIQQIVR